MEWDKRKKQMVLLVTDGTGEGSFSWWIYIVCTKLSAILSAWDLVVLDSLACNYKVKYSSIRSASVSFKCNLLDYKQPLTNSIN